MDIYYASTIIYVHYLYLKLVLRGVFDQATADGTHSTFAITHVDLLGVYWSQGQYVIGISSVDLLVCIGCQRQYAICSSSVTYR